MYQGFQTGKQHYNLERPTSKALLYSEWPAPPETHMETEDANKYYNNLFN